MIQCLWKVLLMQLWLSCHYSLFEVFGALAVQEDSISHDDDADQDGKLLVDWVVKKDGGMVSDKLELRKVKRGLGGYDFGMFATQDFVKDEVVMTIPLSCMVSSTKRYKKNSNKDDSVPQTTLERECQTVHNMVFEYQKGNNSDYYPYMKYIFEGHGNLWGETLKTWSEEGKRVLFDTVIDTELAPQRVFVEQFSYDNDCEPSPQDNEKPDQSVDAETRHLSEQAYVYFLARSRGDSIVPLYDMIPHRNGHWRNVDAEMIPEKRVISVYAHRDIQKGEQLYTSMNECDHLGCEGLEDTYLTQHLFSHFGVLEDYPRRWLLEADPEMDDMDMIIDLDQRKEPDGSKKLFLHWRTPLPDPYQINWIHAHLQRLHRINQTVYEEAATLDAPHERDTTIQYYEAYKEIFQAAWDNRKGDTLDEVESANKREYDSLQYSKSDAVIPYESYAVCTRSISQDVQAGRKEIGLDQSHYQPIRFSYTEGIDVTTLTLNGWVQTATNFRPHYHEPVVHAAAQYMKKVKRIIFLGGGDNMLLHEMMKYKDLELVVGIELDQMVSRLSFKHFGNSPFFDDPRIQWWFGDASKAINVLPDDYFGSFDIVIVDLLTYIADTVKVKGSLSIMDAAALLMKQEGGVILRNEDFSIRSNTAFAKYTVDLDFLDMPYLCEQSITMGSNSIDFLKAETVDHGVEVLVRPLFFPNKNDAQNGVPFDGWNKYRNKRQQTCEAVNDDSLDKDEGDHCDEDTQDGRYGVMTIIEAENASSASKTIPEIQAEVTSVANKFGLKDGSLVVSESSPNVFILVHDEGYITTRVYKDERYIAFDVAIWEDFNRVDAFNDDLVAAVGGSVQKSTTSFKVVTGGMPVRRDVCRNSYLATLSSSAEKAQCHDEGAEDKTKEKNSGSSEKEAAVYEELLMAMIPHQGQPRSLVAVICGQSSAKCQSLDAVQSSLSTGTKWSIVPLYSCDSFEDMMDCELDTLNKIKQEVKDQKPLDGIILDESMPLEMGQVMHKIFNDTKNFDNFLEPELLVVAATTSEHPWRRELVDRFRTEMAIIDPAFHTDFVLSKGDHPSKEHWSIFSSMRNGFFHQLAQSLSNVVEKSPFESFTVLEVENGMKRLVADFQPTSVAVRDSDYDKTEAAKKWKKQVPIAYQTIIQMTAIAPQAPLKEGELALVVFDPDDNPFSNIFEPGTVVHVLSDTQYYVKGISEDDQAQIVQRSVIRKLSKADADVKRVYHVGDVVLYEKAEGIWATGAIEAVTGDNLYSLYLLDYHKSQHHNIPGDRLILQAESDEYKQTPPPLELGRIKKAFQDCLSEIVDGKVDSHSLQVGDGGVMEIAFWPQGQAIMKFDGSTGVEFNLFLLEEGAPGQKVFHKHISNKLPMLATVLLDEFPRGYGGVVNLKKDMEEPPIWLSKYI